MAMLLAVFVFIYGKENSFMVINKYNNQGLDIVMRYWTYLGEGLIWAPLIIYVLLFRRDYFIAVLAGVLLCTLFTQFSKRVIFPDEFRPVVVLGEKVRTIAGLKINRANSFPSGHTSSAFTLALLTAYIVKGRFWMFFFPLLAFFVGYSRVYLAQHFVSDVSAGIFIGILASWISLMLYEKFRKRKKEIQLEQTAIDQAESDGNNEEKQITN